MIKTTLGDVLKRFRIEKNIEAQTICEGLCPVSMMSYFESGERVPDTLLFLCLMERMGVSSEDFAVVIKDKEYRYHMWKEEVLEAIENAKWEKLGKLLESEISKKTFCNQKLERQFFCYAKAIYVATKQKYKEATELVKIAIEQTIFDMFGIAESNTILRGMELHMLMLYLYYGRLGNVLDLHTGRKLFDKLEQYICSERLELNEQAKCYPKLICIGIHLFRDSIDISKQMALCEKAVTLLRKNKTFCDITGLLELYIPLLRETNSKELGFYEKQYETFADILKQNNLDINFRPELFVVRKLKMYMLSEYLRSKRKEKRLTQEKLSEGICEIQTYSRVECGVRKPNRRNLVALAERLGMNWCFYRGELDTYELEAYRLRRDQREAEIYDRWQESLDLLAKMETILDMDSTINYQYVKNSEYMIKFEMQELSAEETYKKLDELLHMTQKMDMETPHLVYYSQTEVEIVVRMAQLLRAQGKYEEGIQLIETVLKQMSRSKVSLGYHWNGVSFALRVLSGLYFASGEYEKSLEIMKYVYGVIVRIKKGINLSTMLDAIADNLEHIGEQYSEEYKKLYCQTYYVADFFGREPVKRFTKSYYEEKFDKNIKWY